MSRPYRRHRRSSRPAPPAPVRYTRRDEDTFWAWSQQGELLGYIYGQPNQLDYRAVHTNSLTTRRDDTSYWAWDENAWLLGLIVKGSRPSRYHCYLPDCVTLVSHEVFGEKTLGTAWRRLRSGRRY